MRWKKDREERTDSVLKRDVNFRVIPHREKERERERMANIIELKRWSGAVSKQVGVWSEKEKARY